MEFLPGREAYALREDVPAARAHPLQQAIVEVVQPFRTAARLRFQERQQPRGRFEVALRAVGLEAHEGAELVVDDAFAEVVLRVAVARHLVDRQVNAVALDVLPQVAEDVGELHRETEVDRGLLRERLVPVTEYADRDEAHDRRNVIAVVPEFVEARETPWLQVHLHARDDVLEERLRDVVRAGGVRQRREDETVRASGVCVAQVLAQRSEFAALLLRAAVAVGDVVGEAAEGVGGVDGVSARAGQGEESVVEVTRLAFGDRLALLVGRVDCGVAGEVVMGGAAESGRAAVEMMSHTLRSA